MKTGDDYKVLKKGLSYQAIADVFNLWEIPTRSAQGTWHAKTI